MPNKVLYSLVGFIALWALINSAFYEPQSQFRQWMEKYGKKYGNDEYTYRYNIFKQTLKQIQTHNQRAKNSLESYYMGINQFSDLNDQQFMEKYLDLNMVESNSNYQCTGPQPPIKDIPQEFDWSAKSAVTAVRNLGSCSGGGYAATSAEVIQSGKYITKGKLSQLSAQQLLDCTGNNGNKGCTSGNILNTFEYVYKEGIASEASYPFKGITGTCNYHISQKEWEILGCVKVTSKNQAQIRAAVRQQPVATSINASKIKNYSSGIYGTGMFSSCKTDPNHWMTIVGYGVQDKKKQKYWKLKNSWGSNWGQHGYFFIIRNDNGEGQCGVQTDLYFPID